MNISLKNVNLVGEELCGEFFVDRDFDQPIPGLNIQHIKVSLVEGCSNTIFQAKKEIDNSEIMAEWFWDGDWTVRFIFPNGFEVFSTDAKKSHNWEIFEGNVKSSDCLSG